MVAILECTECGYHAVYEQEDNLEKCPECQDIHVDVTYGVDIKTKQLTNALEQKSGTISAMRSYATVQAKHIKQLEAAIKWVLTDASYKAPEQVTPECQIWIDRLQRTQTTEDSGNG